jgi:hydrogenase-4 membrane subunit HyfE
MNTKFPCSILIILIRTFSYNLCMLFEELNLISVSIVVLIYRTLKIELFLAGSIQSFSTRTNCVDLLIVIIVLLLITTINIRFVLLGLFLDCNKMNGFKKILKLCKKSICSK